MNNTVYTYYEEIAEINNDPNRKSTQQELIDLCKMSWERRGWQFYVLSYKDAQSHPLYKEYHQIIDALPSVNPKPYDYHCYMRWLAMTNIGGLMIDYDVINIDITPERLEAIIAKTESNKLTVLQGHTPCAVHGSKEQYLEMCNHFMLLKENKDCIEKFGEKEHTSDMYMIAYGLDDKVNKVHFVKDYKNEVAGIENSINGLIHCSQGSVGSRTKKDIMEQLLNYDQS